MQYKPAATENLRNELFEQCRKGKLSGTRQFALCNTARLALFSAVCKKIETLDRNASVPEKIETPRPRESSNKKNVSCR